MEHIVVVLMSTNPISLGISQLKHTVHTFGGPKLNWGVSETYKDFVYSDISQTVLSAPRVGHEASGSQAFAVLLI